MAEQKVFKYPAPGPIELKKITAEIYGVYGGLGANSYFILGKTGVTVIDAKMTEDFGRAVVAEVKKTTSLPITRMIITHSDLDHVNGLSGFPQGMEIISSVKTRSDMYSEFEKNGFDVLLRYLPNETYDTEKELDLGGLTANLYHVAPAHTGGDTIIYLPSQKAAFVGDLLFVGRPPLIHGRKGGTSTGLVKSLKFLLTLDCDKYLSGHAPPIGKNEVETLLNYVESVRTKVIALKARGKSLDDVKRELNVVEMQMPPGRPRFPMLEEVVYGEEEK
jgi:glyoxylase-like metal-dependent hydrolase (beta-lactamase superfamily II)